MRNAADHIDTHVQGTLQCFRRPRPTQISVLGKGDELQIQVGGDQALDLQQRLDRQQPLVADVDMASDGQQTLADGQIAVRHGPFDHGILG